jgi:hypothetical protein
MEEESPGLCARTGPAELRRPVVEELREPAPLTVITEAEDTELERAECRCFLDVFVRLAAETEAELACSEGILVGGERGLACAQCATTRWARRHATEGPQWFEVVARAWYKMRHRRHTMRLLLEGSRGVPGPRCCATSGRMQSAGLDDGCAVQPDGRKLVFGDMCSTLAHGCLCLSLLHAPRHVCFRRSIPEARRRVRSRCNWPPETTSLLPQHSRFHAHAEAPRQCFVVGRWPGCAGCGSS